MIHSFKDELTKTVFEGQSHKGFPAKLQKVARRKLRMIEAATELNDLKVSPGNKLHPLKGDRAGQYAIWINDKYRVCFIWAEGGAHDVEITDYH